MSWNFISTLKRTNKKRNIQQTEKQQDIIFFLVPWGSALAVQVRKGRAEGHGIQGHVGTDVHFSLALPNLLPAHPPPGAAGNIHAVFVREGRWSLLFLSMNMLWSKAVRSSRSLHTQWPSCHQSLSRCTCRLSRCRSSGQMRIPWTV